MAKELVSKIDGRWVHDASSLHGMTVSGTTLYLQWGDSTSAYTTSSTITMNIDAMRYKGVWSTKTSTPTNPVNGDTWKISDAGTYTIDGKSVKLEIGDMIIYCKPDTGAGTWNIIQANIDPTIYAKLTHTHSVTLSGGVSNKSVTPKGTISVAVTGKTTTFSGTNTPAGTISVSSVSLSDTHSHSFNGTAGTITMSYDKANANTGNASGQSITIGSHEYTPEGSISVTLSSASQTNQTANATVSFTGTAHSHSFTGTEAEISVSYKKAAANTGNATPTVSGSITVSSVAATGTIGNTLSSESGSVTFNNTLSVANHKHTFTGSASTFTGDYTPAGTISASRTLSSTSVTYATGAKTTTTDSALKTISFTSTSFVTDVKAASVSASSVSITYTTASEELTHNISSVSNLASTVTMTSTSAVTGVKSTTSFTALKSVTLTTTELTLITDVTPSATFNGTAATITVSGTPQGSTANATASLTGSLTGTYSKVTGVTSTFYGTAHSHTPAFTLSAAQHSHSIGSSDATATGSYTPAGTIGNTTATGTLAISVTFSYIKATGVNGTFSGTLATLGHGSVTIPSHSHSIGKTATEITASYTPVGTISGKTLTLSQNLTATFHGTAGTVTVSGTPQLNAATGTFYGQAESHNHDNDLAVAGVSLPVDA